MTADPLRDQLQATLGASYTLERELGGGGMSRVFVAREEALGRDVVVKVLAPELAEGLSAERFAREIRLAAGLQEPHIVPVLAAGVTAGGLPFYTMPYVRGESLRARLARGPVATADAVAILRDVATALEYAHGQGLVHRDIKPENVLLSGRTAVVTDFGIAKALQASRTRAPDGPAMPTQAGLTQAGLTQLGTSLGTPAYMAPEQAAGDPATDHRADLYAWGVVAYELLAGRHPFADRTSPQALLAAHMAETPAPLPASIPRVLAALVARCLAKDPADRPASAAEVIAALDDAGSPRGAPGVVPARARGRRTPLVLAAAAALLGAAWGGLRLARGGPAGPVLEPKRVVVASFENRSGDRSLDPVGLMAADWIARGLASTGLVDVAGTAAELAARGARDDAAASGRSVTLQALAADARAGLVISGAYYRQGDSLLFQADFTDATAGKLVQSVGPVSAPVARPLDGVERLRQRVSGSLATLVDSGLAGLAGVTSPPPDAEAYREFLAGEDLFYRDEIAATAHYARAAALDSAYLYPLLRLTGALYNAGRYAEADSVGRVLDARRARLSPYERAYLDYLRASIRNDDEGAYRAGVAMERTAPKSAFAAYIHGIEAVFAGRPHEADSVLRALDPAGGALRGRVTYFTNYGIALHALGAYDRQLALARLAERQYPRRLFPQVDAAEALAALGRHGELLARLDTAARMRAENLRISPAGVLTIVLHELRFHGHLDAVPAVRQRLLAWLAAHPSAPGDRDAGLDAARALAATEQWDRLRALADSLVAATPAARSGDDPGALGLLGVALAMRGDRAGAERAAATLAANRSPYRRQQRFEARAGIAAALGDRAGAVALFREGFRPGRLDDERAHGTWLFDRLRDYPPFLAHLAPQG